MADNANTTPHAPPRLHWAVQEMRFMALMWKAREMHKPSWLTQRLPMSALVVLHGLRLAQSPLQVRRWPGIQESDG